MTSTHQPSNDQLGPLTPFQGNPARLSVVLTEYWDVNTLAWVKGTQPSGGGGAITIADGSDVAEGNTADAAWAGIGAGTVVSILKKIATSLVVSTKTDLTPSSPAFATVGVASGVAVAANANRTGLALINTSSARISLGFGAAAVLDSGITLYPGGTFEMDEFLFDKGTVNAIASVAASNLSIQEYA
jgi:hypothetical protein